MGNAEYMGGLGSKELHLLETFHGWWLRRFRQSSLLQGSHTNAPWRRQEELRRDCRRAQDGMSNASAVLESRYLPLVTFALTFFGTALCKFSFWIKALVLGFTGSLRAFADLA